MALEMAFALAHDAVEYARAAAHEDDDGKRIVLEEIAQAKMRHAQGIADFHPIADISSFIEAEEQRVTGLDLAARSARLEEQDELAVWLETCASAGRAHLDWLRDLT